MRCHIFFSTPGVSILSIDSHRELAILAMKVPRIYAAINWNSFNQLNGPEFIERS